MGSIFNEFPTFGTKRLLLRKLSMADVDDLFAYASDDSLTKYLFWETHRSKADSERFISYALHQYDNKGTAPWGIEVKQENKMIGTIDFVSWEEEHRSAEIGYVLSSAYQGQGLMTEAAKVILHYCFNVTDLNRIQARCHIDNKLQRRL